MDTKVPSRIAYLPGMTACSWTKVLQDNGVQKSGFDDKVLEEAAALGIFRLPVEKKPVDVVADYLSCLYQHIRKELTRRFHGKVNHLFVDFWLTIPAAWSQHAKARTMEAATRAGFGQASKDSLNITTEPEAAAETVFKMANTELKVF